MVGNQITRAGCRAHARRKYVDAEKSSPAIAREVVGLNGELHKSEWEAHSVDPAARLSLREQVAKPTLDTLRHKLSDWMLQLLKHPYAKVIPPPMRQWGRALGSTQGIQEWFCRRRRDLNGVQ